MMTPAAPTAPLAPAAPSATAGAGAAAQAVRAAPARPAPWEDDVPARDDGGAAVLEAPVRQLAPTVAPAPAPAPAAAAAIAPPPPVARSQQVAEDDDLPPWVTEFSDDSAVAAPGSHAGANAYGNAYDHAYGNTGAQAASHTAANHGYADAHDAAPAYGNEQPIAMPARAAPAPAKAPYPYVITPVPELDWDGNWPAVAAALPLRGVAQQLAMQAEMTACSRDGNATVFKLRVPIETWRTPGNVEKLTAALCERFGRPVRVDTELGAVWYTASAEAAAFRAACQRAAEETVANDPFVNSLIREFDAWVVPGTIVPPPQQAAA